MRLIKRTVYRCSAIVQPGEYTIDHWDGQQCSETNVLQLMSCEHCENSFCLSMHWHKHLDSL